MYRSVGGRALLVMIACMTLVGCAGSPLREDPAAVAAYMATGGLVGGQRLQELEQRQKEHFKRKVTQQQEESLRAKQAALYLKSAKDWRTRENYAAAIRDVQHAIFVMPDNLAAWRTLLDLDVAVEPYPDVLETTSDKIREDTAMHYGRALLLKRRTGSGVSLDAPWNPIVSQWAREAFDRRFPEFIKRRGKWLPSDREQAKQMIKTLTGCMSPTDMFRLLRWMPRPMNFHEGPNYESEKFQAEESRDRAIERLEKEHLAYELKCARQIGHEEAYARAMFDEIFNLGLLLTAAENAPTAAAAVSIPSSQGSTTP